MSKNKKSLAETHPEVAKQWHPTKNGDLTPNNVTPGSNKKVWWKCDKEDDHEWESSICNRSSGKNCPFCSGQKVCLSNSFQSLGSKHLLDQWCQELNGDLTPLDLTFHSGKKVWWKCKVADDHIWETPLSHRTSRKRGCPYCSGDKITLSNSLFTTNPKLLSEWYYGMNKNISPKKISQFSNKKVWWKCEKGEDHIWKTSPNERQKYGCPICSKRKIVQSNCLATTHPELAKQWHPTNNGKLTPNDVHIGSSKKVWWKCDKGDDHEWSATVAQRSTNTGCPICINKKVVTSNCLATTHPELAKQWHPTNNGKLTPNDVHIGSSKKVWWKCDKGDDHEWKTSLSHRNKGGGCPICSNRKIVQSNCLATTHPKIAKQWHPTKNGKLTPNDVHFGSKKKVWWKCDKGDDHEWRVSPSIRKFDNTSCPFCTLTPQSKQELTITFELMKQFKNIDPKGLKTRLNGRLRAIDIFIPKLNLCIEFDGSYWHKGKRELDKIKSEMLFEEGFKLIRVREEPLKKIYDTDVISKQPYNGKQVTNDILSMILSIFELDAKLVSNIKAYQSKDGLQNEKGLDEYIDKILTEKAEKSG